MFSHLNNPIYGILVDSIVNEFLMTHPDIQYNTTGYPRTALVANTYCDYFGPLNYPGIVDVGLRVAKIGKNSVMYECGFFKRGDETVKAVGGFVQIWVLRENGKAPEDGLEEGVRKALEGLTGVNEGAETKAKI